MSSPLHIQPYAQLIGISAETFEIVCYSDNLPGHSGGAAGANQPEISQLFSQATLLAARASAARPYPTAIPLTHREPADWGERQLIPHRVGECLLLEIEPRNQPRPLATNLLQSSELALTAALSRADSVQSIMEIGCHQLTETLGLERGCFYQLDYPGGPGQVTAETLTGGLPSIAGVHFRSGDFPEEGYRKLETDAVMAYPVTDRPMVAVLGDTTTFAGTIEYGIASRTPFSSAVDYARSSDLGFYLCIAISTRSRLLGLLCGHSREKIILDYQHRLCLYRCKLEMERALASLNDRRQYRSHRAIDHRRSRIKNSIAESTDLFRGLTEATPPLLDYLNAATGVTVSIDGDLFSSGRTPEEEEVKDLLQWVATQGTDGELYATDTLQGVYRPSKVYKEIAAGILAVPLGRQRSDFIIWYRPEVITLAEFGSLEGPRFSSRNGRHFAMTVEPRTGHSLPWADEQLAAARELQTFIQEVAVGRYNKLTRINEQLKTAYSELEDFSYTVSHDLRAPLRGIDGYAEILMEEYHDELSDDAAELVRTIQYNAALMNQSITDILELSRVGRVQLRVQDCDVVQLVRQASEEIGDQIGTTVEVDIKGPLPSLRGDCAQLLIVIRHLLSNAVKYSSKQAEQRITVGFRRSDKGGDGQFYVADNGIGIPPHHQERIFGMFNRLVIEENYSGKGVGLAIVKRIILRHNGRVSVESEVGRGATFLFYTDPEDPK